MLNTEQACAGRLFLPHSSVEEVPGNEIRPGFQARGLTSLAWDLE